MVVSAVWICLHRLMVVHQLRGVNERGQKVCSLGFLFTSILKQALAPFKRVPAFSKSPKEGSTLIISDRRRARNVSKRKECKEERKFCRSIQRQAEHIPAPELIAFWVCAHITFVHRGGDRGASIHVQLGQSALSVGDTWTPSSSAQKFCLECSWEFFDILCLPK